MHHVGGLDTAPVGGHTLDDGIHTVGTNKEDKSTVEQQRVVGVQD